ncbi:MAG: choloylglycine hydrolase [Oscillospiraceae bacterium]
MCTSFAVYGQNNPIYGMNFDAEEIDLKLKINDYADRYVFCFSGLMGEAYVDIAGINSDGLFICSQALEYSPNFQPSSDEKDIFAFDVFEEALRERDSLPGFFDALNNRSVFFPSNPLFPNMGVHAIIADQHGDAAILEEGTRTNVISKINGAFIVMTNFPNGDFEKQKFDEVCGCGADRYINAYINIKDNMNDFGVNEAFDVLKKTRQDITICSIVFDPSNFEAYICFNIDFGKRWKISLKEKRMYSLSGLNDNRSMLITAEGVHTRELYKFYE